MAKPALGKGLNALLGSIQTTPSQTHSIPNSSEQPQTQTPKLPADPTQSVVLIPLDNITPSSLQTRRDFDETALSELAESIKQKGVLQPILVRKTDNGFELIAGERRFRAAKLAGLNSIPAIIHAADDMATLELMLIENLQREDLNPIDEAYGYEQLMQKFSLTQEQAASKVGKNRATVANALRLLKLPQKIQQWIKEDKLTAGHAKAIASLSDPNKQIQIAEKVVNNGLSVRETEALVAKINSAENINRTNKPIPIHKKNLFVEDLQSKLQEKLGTKTIINYKNGKGTIQIKFFSEDELERLLIFLGIRLD